MSEDSNDDSRFNKKGEQQMKQIGKTAFALAAAVIASTTWAKTYTLTVKSTDTSRGTVSGGGSYKAGTKLTVTAKAKSGYVFGGWFSDKACTERQPGVIYKGNYLDPSVKVQVDENAKMYAKFITKSADKKALKLSGLKKYESTPFEAVSGESFGNLITGASYLSRSTLTFKNLPKGLELLGNEVIEGTPTVPGKYTVTATLTSAGGYSVTQKFIIRVKVPDWAKGTFNGYAFPDGGNNPGGYMTFTVGSTGKISGKVNYKGKAYSFTSKYKSCSAKKAKFTPSALELGSKVFDPGSITVTPRPERIERYDVTEAVNVNSTFIAQKRCKLICSGGDLAFLNGNQYKFTNKDSNSGLKKGDSLEVLLKNDVAQIAGTVGGKSLAVGSVPLFITSIELPDGAEYKLCVYIYDSKANYRKWLFFNVTTDAVVGGELDYFKTEFRDKEA